MSYRGGNDEDDHIFTSRQEDGHFVIDGIDMVVFSSEDDCDSDMETASDLDASSCWGSSHFHHPNDDEYWKRGSGDDQCFPLRQLPSGIRRGPIRRRTGFPRHFGSYNEKDEDDDDSMGSVASCDSLECARRRGISGLANGNPLMISPTSNSVRAFHRTSRGPIPTQLRQVSNATVSVDGDACNTYSAFESEDDFVEEESTFRTYHIALK